MKSRRSLLKSVCILVGVGLAAVALGQAISGKRVNNAEVVPMVGTNVYTVVVAANTTVPLNLATVELTFANSASNTLTVNLVRSNYTYKVIDRTVTNWTTYIWFAPRDIQLIGNDQLVVTKSRNDNAQLTLGWK